ncbi:MAG: peptidase M23 [Bacillota bacterium]|nr:MAG: peptidase M23 [Bacillota bacterium]
MGRRFLSFSGSHAPPRGSWRWLVAFVPAVVVVFLFSTTVYVQSRATYYHVSLNGQPLGYVAAAEVVEEAVALAEEGASDEYRFHVRMAEAPEVEQIVTHDRYETLSVEALAERLRAAATFLTRATVLMVDGEEVAALPSRAAAESVLEQLKRRYAQQVERSARGGRVDVRKVQIRERIQLVERDGVPADQVRDAVEVATLLMGGTEKPRVHVVREGESPWTIASANGITVEELLAANPGIDPERIKPGEELRLTVPEQWITFASEETLTVTERIPYGTRQEYDRNLEAGKRRVKQEGRPGEKVITYAIVREDGRVVREEKVSEEILREPVDRVVVIGTKPVAGASSGRLLWPLRGTVTSGFGPRWGEMHTGIDIDGVTGQPVRAADGGTVVSAGWDGGYGNAVQIRHGDRLYTFYGHLSRIAVRVGEKVSQGQVIGYVGSTGRSTGSHLHFEVRRCPSPSCAVSPLGYLR